MTNESNHTAVAETAVLLSLLVRAMVHNRDAVQVTSRSLRSGICFQIRVADAEMGKLIGRTGRVARLLRQLLWCIAQEHGMHFEIEIVQDRAGRIMQVEARQRTLEVHGSLTVA